MEYAFSIGPACNFTKIGIHHACFSVSFVKYFRKVFYRKPKPLRTSSLLDVY